MDEHDSVAGGEESAGGDAFERASKVRAKPSKERFRAPEVVKGTYFVREYRFNPDRQQVEYVCSPTDPAKRDQEITVSILADQSVDKGRISKSLMENLEDVVELGLVMDQGATHAYAYEARGMRKERTLMGMDEEGKLRPAFLWTEGVDNNVDKIHGYQAKATAARELNRLAIDPDSQRLASERARDEATQELLRLDPTSSREAIDAWLEKNFDEQRSVGIALAGEEVFNGAKQNRYYNADYALGAQLGGRDWAAMPDHEKSSALNNYAYQRALQGMITDRTMQAQTHNGKEVSAHELRELTLVEKGQLYAVNPTLTPELRSLENREFCEREAGRAVRCAMAVMGAKPADKNLDDIRVGEASEGPDGKAQHKTLASEILAVAVEHPAMKAASALGKGSVSNLAKLDALTSVVENYSEQAVGTLIHGKDGLIEEQDEKGAIQPGFERTSKHTVIKEAAEVVHEQTNKQLPKLMGGLNSVLDETIDGPSHQFIGGRG